MKKDKDYFNEAVLLSEMSKDPSTKVGAVFFNKRTGLPITYGYNGLPRGFDDACKVKNYRPDDFKWGDGKIPEKYHWYEHAERNALYNHARAKLTGNNLVLNSHFPSMEGARALIAVGIEKVIYFDFGNISEEEAKRVYELFDQSGVIIQTLDQESVKWVDPSKLKAHFKFLSSVVSSIRIKGLSHKKFSVLFSLDSLSMHPHAMGYTQPPKIKVWNRLSSNERETRLSSTQVNFIEPEKMMIVNAIKSEIAGSWLATNWCPCENCSSIVVAAGVKKIITRKIDPLNEADKRWEASFNKSIRFFEESKVKVSLIG